MAYTKEELLTDVWQFQDEFGSTSTLVLGQKKALVYDTMTGSGDYLSEIRKLTELPLILVNSHGHYDHLGGNYQFSEAYLNLKDMELWEINKKNIGILEEIKQVKLPNCHKSYEHPPVFHDLTEGTLFDLGGISAQAIALPGHTAGCMGLYLTEKKTVLVGDAVSPQVCLIMDGVQTIDIYKKSVEKLLYMNPDYFICGHYMRLFPAKLLNDIYKAADAVGVKRGFPYQFPNVPSYTGTMYITKFPDREFDDFICIIVNDLALNKNERNKTMEE